MIYQLTPSADTTIKSPSVRHHPGRILSTNRCSALGLTESMTTVRTVENQPWDHPPDQVDPRHELDPNCHCLLYCEQGTMSLLQALHLRDHGLHNVAMLAPLFLRP